MILLKSFYGFNRWEVPIKAFISRYDVAGTICNRIITPIISRFTTTYCKGGTKYQNNKISHIMNFRQNYINFTISIKKAVK